MSFLTMVIFSAAERLIILIAINFFNRD